MERKHTPIHLRPHAPVAERVLLPGDPGRALRLAQALMDAPKMLNHNRGLWGYTGVAPDGEPLTIQSSGMGGGSAAIVVEELIALGAQRIIRVGTCGALDGGAGLGDLIAVERAGAGDGASRALGAGAWSEPDGELLAALRPHADHAGDVVTVDLFYGPDAPPGAPAAINAPAGTLAVEMEAATVLTLARLRGARAAALLLTSDLVATGQRLDEEALHAGELRLGQAALAALLAN